MEIPTIESLSHKIDIPILRIISSSADDLGLECYIVGGYVRDIFLSRPSKDIDIVAVGSGIALANEVCRRLDRRVNLAVFRRFGTAQIKWCGTEIEFVGARKESYSPNSRNPAIENGTLEDDINRRDFTINAMSICLNSARFGQFYDPFDGLRDLQDGIIATPLDPDVTFDDDPLRMMRCVRFASQLNFSIEEETFLALQRNANRLRIVSSSRISEEFNKIMLTQTPSRGLMEMQRSGLLEIVLPEISVLDKTEIRQGFTHKNNFYHSLEVLDNISRLSDKLFFRWAALLHDIGKSRVKRFDSLQGFTFRNHDVVGARMIAQIFRRLALPLDHRMRYVEKLILLHMRPINIADDEVTDSAVRRLLNDAGEDIDDLMTLCEADVTSKNEVRRQRFIENFRLVRTKIANLKEKDYRRLLQPCIDGNEIMQLFSLGSCPEVGRLKSILKEAVLDNRVPNEREPLMQLLLKEAQNIGLSPINQHNTDNT